MAPPPPLTPPPPTTRERRDSTKKKTLESARRETERAQSSKKYREKSAENINDENKSEDGFVAPSHTLCLAQTEGVEPSKLFTGANGDETLREDVSILLKQVEQLFDEKRRDEQEIKNIKKEVAELRKETHTADMISELLKKQGKLQQELTFKTNQNNELQTQLVAIRKAVVGFRQIVHEQYEEFEKKTLELSRLL